ncbi:MAG: SdpI family protein [Oscillospiraceae bacterium]|nr:SdpI family protein [Oscillospiraceae bacterium]
MNKMNKRKKTNIIIFILLLAALAVLLVAYPSMPEIIPTHWGTDGQVDGTGHKSTLFMLWGIIAGCNLLMPFAEKIDPKGENYEKFSKVFEIFRIFFTLFMLVVLGVNIYAVYRPAAIDMNAIMFPLMGLLFIVLGNYMPKIKHNYTFGIKCPWTLASENVWNKTHRMAGPVWVVGGLITAGCGFIEGIAAAIAMTVVIAVIVIIPMVYSYVEFNKEKNSEE